MYSELSQQRMEKKAEAFTFTPWLPAPCRGLGLPTEFRGVEPAAQGWHVAQHKIVNVLKTFLLLLFIGFH